MSQQYLSSDEENILFEILEGAELQIEDIQNGLTIVIRNGNDSIVKSFIQELASGLPIEEVEWMECIPAKEYTRIMTNHCRDLIADRQLKNMLN